MNLQFRDAKNGQVVWRDYTVDGRRWTVDGETVRSPVDIDALPASTFIEVSVISGEKLPIL